MLPRLFLLGSVVFFCAFGSCAAADDIGADAANVAFLNAKASAHAPVTSSLLACYDMPGPSGVPLGGIGVGCVEFNPLGQFFRNGLNCVHDDYIIRDVPGSFFALWEGTGEKGRAVRLVRDGSVKYGMRGFDHSVYRGLFPTARVYFENDGAEPTARASIYAYSGLVPRDVKDSSLPVIWFEVTLQNPGSKTDVSVAFSWQDILGRQIYDLHPDQPLPVKGHFDKNQIGGPLPRVKTVVEPWQVDAWAGLKISTPAPFQPRMPSYQNYVQELGILTEQTSDARITILPSWNEKNGAEAWRSFCATGAFGGGGLSAKTPLYDPAQGSEASTAIAVKTTLRAGETKKIRFGLVWYFPELKPAKSPYGTADYGRPFQNDFATMEDLYRYAAANRARVLEATLDYQKPILESTYPEWLQFMILNSAYEIYTNSILNRAGFFTENEGGMGGLAGTVGCRAVSRTYHQRFFPELDRSDMLLSAATQDPSGAILHFTGNYYQALADPQGYTPLPHSSYLDDTPGWIEMVDTEYWQSGDKEWLRKMLPAIKKGVAYLQKAYVPGTHIPWGGAAYDDFPNPKIYSYQASVYLAMFGPLRDIAEALGDPDLIKFCQTEPDLVRQDFIRLLWNGRFFAHGCDADGSHRQDFCLFGGQLAGEFGNRITSRDDIVPFDMVQASAVSQFKTSVAHSPDNYADKRYDLEAMRGIDMPGSRCWPFYYEMNTAMLGMQAGYYQDGMALMKRILDVNLERGFAWTLNLWRPGELTRIDAPVTWYMTDLLAGFGVDAAKNTLYLAPDLPPGDHTEFKLPVYAQKFWGIVGIDTKKKYIALRVLKNFGDPLEIRTLISQPSGLPSSAAKTLSISPVLLKEGAVIDLSRHYDELVRGNFYPSIFADPSATPWKTVKNPYTGADGYDASLNDLLRVWDSDYRSGSK